MTAVIIILLSICVVAAIFYFYKILRINYLDKHGNKAEALILDVQLTGVQINSELQAVIQLQVKPEKEKNFVIEVKEILNVFDFKQMQPGVKLMVKYNPYNHKIIKILREDHTRHFVLG